MSAAFMTLLLVCGIGLFAWTARRRWELMLAAKAPADRSNDPARRMWFVLKYVFGQARMFRYWWAGVAHALIFGGFMVLALRTIILISRGYAGDPHFGFWFFDDGSPLGNAYTFLKDLIGVGVIAGVAYFLYTRLVTRPARMELSTEGIVILCMILGLIVADMTYEATGFVRGAWPGVLTFHAAAPAASTLSFVLSALPASLLDLLHSLGFWLHTILVLSFLNFLPYGKHFHVLTILPQVYFSNPQPRGRLTPILDMEGRIERGESLGTKRAADLSWKAVLDLYTCTECGRCSDQCPATRTGKLLSPKHLTLELREHLYRNEIALRRTVASVSLAATADSSAPDAAAASAGGAGGFVGRDGAVDSTNGELIGPWIDAETLWACTTCGACEQECPVFISYVDKIVDLRRNLVMERGEFPDQLQNAFRGLESVGNPYSFANEQRADWAAGLDIPLRSEKPNAEVLYWVGCSPSFDDRARKIARATALLMKRGGVDFAILGREEQCTGDPARRAGNEYLFQTLATANVQTLNSYGVRKIVTTCPHCFNTLRNEYPDFGGRYEVVHHTEFLLQLVRAGKLQPRRAVDGTVVYHDSCYLGRYNDVYDPPRELLRAIPGLRVVEAPESRDRGMCCGAGGAQMWKEEEHIRRQSDDARGRVEAPGKVNHARTRQLLRVLPSAGPRTVASACPFCMTMLSDGLRDQGHEDVQRQDVAELLLQAVELDSG
ncbi:MAG: (Fe-S)-binding protein [Phycisphaerae bacterium]